MSSCHHGGGVCCGCHWDNRPCSQMSQQQQDPCVSSDRQGDIRSASSQILCELALPTIAICCAPLFYTSSRYTSSRSRSSRSTNELALYELAIRRLFRCSTKCELAIRRLLLLLTPADDRTMTDFSSSTIKYQARCRLSTVCVCVVKGRVVLVVVELTATPLVVYCTYILCCCCFCFWH